MSVEFRAACSQNVNSFKYPLVVLYSMGWPTRHYKSKEPLFPQRLLDSLLFKMLICCCFIIDLFLEFAVRRPGLTLV